MSPTRQSDTGVASERQIFANQICPRSPKLGHRWHLDEMRVEIKGEVFWLWRAVDEDGNVLDILMQRRRHKAAAKKFMIKLLKKHLFAPYVIVTDKLKSYAAAKKEILPSVEHRQHNLIHGRVYPQPNKSLHRNGA